MDEFFWVYVLVDVVGLTGPALYEMVRSTCNEMSSMPRRYINNIFVLIKPTKVFIYKKFCSVVAFSIVRHNEIYYSNFYIRKIVISHQKRISSYLLVFLWMKEEKWRGANGLSGKMIWNSLVLSMYDGPRR